MYYCIQILIVTDFVMKSLILLLAYFRHLQNCTIHKYASFFSNLVKVECSLFQMKSESFQQIMYVLCKPYSCTLNMRTKIRCCQNILFLPDQCVVRIIFRHYRQIYLLIAIHTYFQQYYVTVYFVPTLVLLSFCNYYYFCYKFYYRLEIWSYSSRVIFGKYQIWVKIYFFGNCCRDLFCLQYNK
eukprot:TRINITY_DN6637_c0_g1_i1.p1 TRINITY_DN6637_c0_g1~~TRINITY_DN6637_c0_g1_i1.p1  ORF type:complete len:191 (-),score=-15.55 TRINITY_DN6637_c0_g1_i1:303-854(-)